MRNRRKPNARRQNRGRSQGIKPEDFYHRYYSDFRINGIEIGKNAVTSSKTFIDVAKCATVFKNVAWRVAKYGERVKVQNQDMIRIREMQKAKGVNS